MLTPLLAVAILTATAGVVVMSYKPGRCADRWIQPTVMGIVSGGMFRCRRSRQSRRHSQLRARRQLLCWRRPTRWRWGSSCRPRCCRPGSPGATWMSSKAIFRAWKPIDHGRLHGRVCFGNSSVSRFRADHRGGSRVHWRWSRCCSRKASRSSFSSSRQQRVRSAASS